MKQKTETLIGNYKGISSQPRHAVTLSAFKKGIVNVSSDDSDNEHRQKLDLLAYAPCTLKQTFKNGIDSIAVRERVKGNPMNYFVPLGCATSKTYDLIWQEKDLDLLPNIIISIGFGDFFRPEFQKNHIDSGHFKAVIPPVINSSFINAGVIDPENRYTVYSGQTYLLMVDLLKLGSLPVPKKWADILDPMYRNNVIIGGSKDELSEILLLSIYKDFGEEGMRKLASNVKDVWHCSQMAKYAGSGSDEGAAIYVISSFFAHATPESENVQIVIPDDGMILSPLYMLVKTNEAERLKEFTDYVVGEDYGKILSDAAYPVLNGLVADSHFSHAPLKWIGWDYIRGNDLFSSRYEVYDIFRGYFEKSSVK